MEEMYTIGWVSVVLPTIARLTKVPASVVIGMYGHLNLKEFKFKQEVTKKLNNNYVLAIIF